MPIASCRLAGATDMPWARACKVGDGGLPSPSQLKFDWELTEPDHPVITPVTEFPKGLPEKVQAVHTDL